METLFLINKTLFRKTKFFIDINVEINGDIIFQTSVYDPCNCDILTSDANSNAQNNQSKDEENY